MVSDIVRVEKKDGIAVVTFDRGGSLNAFTQDMLKDLTEVALSFQEDYDTKAVVLTGAKNAFSAGNDLKDPVRWDLDSQPFAHRRTVLSRGQRMMSAWESVPQMTIAAINGMAVGGGAALTLACDWRVMASDAYLYVPEVKHGLHVAWATMPRLTALVGPARAKRIAILCEKMHAPQALDWGLIDEIGEAGGAVEKALEMARKVAELPSQVANTQIKETVNASAYALLRSLTFMEPDQSLALIQSPEVAEGRKRFLAR